MNECLSRHVLMVGSKLSRLRESTNWVSVRDYYSFLDSCLRGLLKQVQVSEKVTNNCYLIS